MSVRCKMYCTYKQPVEGGEHVHFAPVVDGSEENKEFFKYTPGGNLMFYTVNPFASTQFELGKQYYVDLSPAE